GVPWRRPPFLQHGPLDRRWVAIPTPSDAGWQPMPILSAARSPSLQSDARKAGTTGTRPTNQGGPMKTTNVNGIELAYDVQGEGEPVLFIHGAIFADFLRPLAEQPAFSGFHRIRYHRRGYGASGGPAGGFDMQAADIVALLDHLRGDRAPLCGHRE